jgi:hypothetical protein
MIDASHRLRLAQQPHVRLVRSHRLGAEQLDRDLAIEVRIVRGVDDAHAAGAEHVEHDEAPDLLAASRGVGLLGRRSLGNRARRVRVDLAARKCIRIPHAHPCSG